MADYTKVNLREVEDSAEKHGFAPALSARFANGPLELERLGLSLQRVAPNTRAPFGHRHESQEEVYVVVAGGGRIKLDDEVLDLRTWDAIRVAPGVMRSIEAGPDGLEYLAFGAPNTDNKDAQVVQGWWRD